jgi:hypothetical protein
MALSLKPTPDALHVPALSIALVLLILLLFLLLGYDFEEEYE